MSWNYRILAFEYKTPDSDSEIELRVCAVYYTKQGKPYAYSEKEIVSSSEGIKGLKWVLKKYQEAIKKPILYATSKKFPKVYKEKK